MEIDDGGQDLTRFGVGRGRTSFDEHFALLSVRQTTRLCDSDEAEER